MMAVPMAAYSAWMMAVSMAVQTADLTAALSVVTWVLSAWKRVAKKAVLMAASTAGSLAARLVGYLAAALVDHLALSSAETTVVSTELMSAVVKVAWLVEHSAVWMESQKVAHLACSRADKKAV